MATKLTLIPTWNQWELCKDEVCIDVGANLGDTVNRMLESGATKVYCIEAGAVNSEVLRKRFAGDSRIVVHEIGVSDEKTTLKNVTWLNAWVIGDPDEMGLPISPGACDVEGYERVNIELDTIDNIFKDLTEPIGFIKIDVDGYDYKALKGGLNLIQKNRPIIFIELSYYYNIVKGSSVSAFMELVEQINYKFIDVNGKICTPEYILQEFPYHSSCDVFLCPAEKLGLFAHHIQAD
jgi:FkbM family methyltransferase